MAERLNGDVCAMQFSSPPACMKRFSKMFSVIMDVPSVCVGRRHVLGLHEMPENQGRVFLEVEMLG